MNLSKHFTLEEFLDSNTARRRGIDNSAPAEHVDNMRALCVAILQPVRDYYGKPVGITSGYRSAALNRAVGGSKTSQHSFGQAADFHVKGFQIGHTFSYIANSGLPFDQLIYEFGGWVHCSYGPRNRRQILIASKYRNRWGKMKTKYEQITPGEAAAWTSKGKLYT